MNLRDFAYLNSSLDTKDLYGSDSCIANLFLLQEKYNTQLKIHNNILLRYYNGEENRTGYGFPIPMKNGYYIEENDGKIEFLKTALDVIFSDTENNRTPAFCLITQEQKNLIDECLAKYFPDKHISWKTNRDDCDYIYLRENLAELPGAVYHKKRNHISRFNRSYGSNWKFKSFPENDVFQDILTVAQKWFEEKDGENNHVLQLEHQSIKYALENAELLRLRGGVLYINEEPAGMTLASPISDNVLDVIYEKCTEEHEKNGAYAVINQQFAKRSSSFLYMNREEDMGIEGLRKAKLSYKPTILLEKFYGSF